MYPDFLCIGAQRAGSTWLDTNLRKHPNLWLPPIKEIHYFNYKETNHLQNRLKKIMSSHWRDIIRQQLSLSVREKDFERVLWNFKYFSGGRTDEWYHSLFEPQPHQIAGEVTPDYSALSAETVEHIHSLMPNAKIILMLRDPIRRAWSYVFSHTLRGQNLEEIPSEVLIQHCTKRYSFLRGNYARTIEVWRSFYPRQQFFVGFFEEIKTDPEALLARICQFLNVSASAEYLANIERKKVYSFGNTANVPMEVEIALAKLHYDDIVYLKDRYGDVCQSWLNHAESLIELTSV
ncbi:MAG: sulfotransferase [Bacteroidota bacterium]